jgi:G:T-mismatch repair DNA endonuclease (very short patch repair protein)
MTKPELIINDILLFMFGNYNPFKYTGNRKFWLDLNGKLKNPDFVFIEDKKIIEVFGRYWHKNEEEKILIKQYQQIDWDCLVIWEDQIDLGITDKIMQFTFPYEFQHEIKEPI